jgi:hypothetical protein
MEKMLRLARMLRVMLRLWLGLALCSTLAAGVPTITAVGSKFFTSDGNQFFIKGQSMVKQWMDASADTLIICRRCLSAYCRRSFGQHEPVPA